MYKLPLEELLKKLKDKNIDISKLKITEDK